MKIEEKRLERLRNLLSPFINLPQMIEQNEDGVLDVHIENTTKMCNQLQPLLKRALADDVTLEELNELYINEES